MHFSRLLFSIKYPTFHLSVLLAFFARFGEIQEPLLSVSRSFDCPQVEQYGTGTQVHYKVFHDNSIAEPFRC